MLFAKISPGNISKFSRLQMNSLCEKQGNNSRSTGAATEPPEYQDHDRIGCNQQTSGCKFARARPSFGGASHQPSRLASTARDEVTMTLIALPIKRARWANRTPLALAVNQMPEGPPSLGNGFLVEPFRSRDSSRLQRSAIGTRRAEQQTLPIPFFCNSVQALNWSQSDGRGRPASLAQRRETKFCRPIDSCNE